jgi:6-phosphogluconolactonase
MGYIAASIKGRKFLIVMQFHVFENIAAMSEGAADWIANYIAAGLRVKPAFSLLLSGGNTPKELYRTLAGGKYNISWERVNIFFGDERAVPFNDERNNGGMAYELLLKNSGIPSSQIHYIDTSVGREKSASQYETTLRKYFSDSGVTFDLALLGMGNDGHTLSLFPGQRQVHEQSKWVVPSEAPEQPVERISLTTVVVNRSACIALLVAGKSKAGILDKVIRGKYDPDLYPVQIIKNNPENIHLFTDRDAIAEVLKNTA